jgi:hypothetical protein
LFVFLLSVFTGLSSIELGLDEQKTTADPSTSLRSAQDDSICGGSLGKSPIDQDLLTRLLQRICLGYAYSQRANASDYAYTLRYADGSARVQKIEQV